MSLTEKFLYLYRKASDKPMSEEQRKLGQYLTGIIFITSAISLVLGTSYGMVMYSLSYIEAFIYSLLVGFLILGFSIVVAFGAAREIYEDKEVQK